MLSVNHGDIKYHFWVFGMTRPGIEPRPPRSFASTLTTMPMSSCNSVFVSQNETAWRSAAIEEEEASKGRKKEIGQPGKSTSVSKKTVSHSSEKSKKTNILDLICLNWNVNNFVQELNSGYCYDIRQSRKTVDWRPVLLEDLVKVL